MISRKRLILKKALLSMSLAAGLMLGTNVVGISARAESLTEDQKKIIKERVEFLVENGNAYVDISDLDIHVMMYNDRMSPEYTELCDYITSVVDDLGYVMKLGSHTQSMLGAMPNTIVTENGDPETGCGENLVDSISLGTDPYYVNEDMSVNVDAIKEDIKSVPKEYELALSLVNDSMTDLEKALILYDYIQAVSNYPAEVAGVDDGGNEYYQPEDYDAISVFRNHESVCAANATAYCYLLQDAGIDSICVESTEMNHAWTMLKIDGEWFHADPTWDDQRYFDSTYYNDPNADAWDLGATNHFYFLKSDEEMVNMCDHYGWNLMFDYTKDGLSETPAAETSAKYDNYIFGFESMWPKSTNINYIDGTWYFLNNWENTVVKCTNLDGSDAEAIDVNLGSEELMENVFSANGMLYISTPEYIYQYSPKTGNTDAIIAAVHYISLNDYSTGGIPAKISEMNIASGKLNLVVLVGNAEGELENSEGERFRSEAASYDVSELPDLQLLYSEETTFEDDLMEDTQEYSEDATPSDLENTSSDIESLSNDGPTSVIEKNEKADRNISVLKIIILTTIIVLIAAVVVVYIIIKNRKNVNK